MDSTERLIEEINGLSEEAVDLLVDLINYLSTNDIEDGGVAKATVKFVQDRLESIDDEEDMTQSVIRPRRMGVIEEDFENVEEPEQLSYPKTPQERAKIENLLRGFYGCKDLKIEQMDAVIIAFEPVSVSAGEYIIHQGDDGREFFLIDSGRYEVIKNGVVIHEFKEAGFFGELALFYNAPRSASIKAIIDGRLWKISHTIFRKRIVSLAKKRDELYESAFTSNPIFNGTDMSDKIDLINNTFQAIYNDGEQIFAQGENGDYMCFVEDGLVRIEMEIDGNVLNVAEHATGDYFGELALIDNKPRAASAYSVGRTRIGILTAEKFEKHMEHLKDLLDKNRSRYIDMIKERSNPK